MVAYFLLYITCLFSALLETINLKRGKIVKFFFNILTVSTFILVSGLRYKVGLPDWGVYESYFTSIVNKNPYFTFEIGYVIYNKLLSYIFINPQMFFLTTSTIITFITLYWLKKELKYPYLALLIYISLFYFSLNMLFMRQNIALVFSYLGLYLWKNNKKTKSVIFFMLAFSFHYFSIVFIILLYFINKKWNIKFIICIYLIGFVMMLLNISIADQAINIISILDVVKQKVATHLAIETFNHEAKGKFGIAERFITMIFVSYLFYKKRFNTEGKHLYYNIFVIYNLIFVYLWKYGFFIKRLNLYFGFSICFIYIFMIESFETKTKTIIILLLILYASIKYAMVMSYLPSSISEGGFLPYNWKFK